jgi:MoaA/NifB/PqqE/SkfB family radical SAM enzyme
MPHTTWRPMDKKLRRAARLLEISARKTVLDSPPATINIEFSGRCNVWPPCTYCVGKNKPGYEEPPHIPQEQLEPYMKYLLEAERVNDTTYGEPLMYPGIHDLIDRLGSAGVRFGFTTNGLLLSEKKARLLAKHSRHVDICISLNAASREVYYAHQGKEWDRLIENIERFVAIHHELRPGEQIPLVLSFIVMRSNQHEVMEFVRLTARLGAKAALLRHLFDLHEDGFEASNFGHHFVYGRERLAFADYKEIERSVRESEEFRAGEPAVYFAWNGGDSFIREQAEPGIDIPCLFPWKFLCIRPIHGYYTPCVYLKKGIARTSDMTVEEVWNGEVMQGLRRSLARGEVPAYCCENSDICPLVLEHRAKQAAEASDDARHSGHQSPDNRRVSLPILNGA